MIFAERGEIITYPIIESTTCVVFCVCEITTGKPTDIYLNATLSLIVDSSIPCFKQPFDRRNRIWKVVQFVIVSVKSKCKVILFSILHGLDHPILCGNMVF